MPLNQDFIAELRKHFTGDIRLDQASRILYSTDASIYQMEPLGVVIPNTQEDLHAAVELAAKYKTPILPRGAGSSLAGQAIGEALILDISRWLNKLVEIDPEKLTATIEPGLVLAELNRAAAIHGLTFGPDPASAERATLGGVIGNNATGAHSILYGMTADHLVSAEVILSDGSLAKFEELSLGRARQVAADVRPTADFAFTELDVPASVEATLYASALHIREMYADAIKDGYPNTWRNSAGYRLNYLMPWSASRPSRWVYDRYPNLDPSNFNLAPLLAGSEGTLAIIRRATLNLVQKPKHTVLAVLAYESVAAACDAVPNLLTFDPSAVELIPQMLIRLAREVPAYARQIDFVDGDPAALLAIEFAGDNPDQLVTRARYLGEAARVITDKGAQARVWNVRKVGLGIFDSRPVSKRPIAFIEDCAIPVERLGEFVREVQRILAAHDSYAAFYAHASAGCLHIRPVVDLKTGEGVRNLRLIAEETLALTLRLGGAMSSEHGDGLVRGEWLKKTYGETVFGALELLKDAADPHAILNPKKMTSAPPMDLHLRYGESYQVSTWEPSLDFSRKGGVASAIEQCNGQGVCRKVTGVMCPSFQATRDEQNSTRGRANLLRAMISLGNNSLPVENVKAALDLCLACKGCQAECPSGVDMARLKYEFQHEYYRSHPRKIRDYLFGYINQLAPKGALVGELANKLVELPAIKRGLGLSEKRAFPKYSRSSISDSSQSSVRDRAETVLYLPDTFSRYFEPEIEHSVMKVLSTCKISVISLSILGAGRTLISKGFLEPARRHAGKLLDAVQELDPNGLLPIVGAEPSEIYSLKDEFIDLVPERRTQIEALASRTWMVEEFLVRHGKDGKKRVLRIDNGLVDHAQSSRPRLIHLHGHCYQKAQPPAADGFSIGQDASAELLRSAGFEVEIVPSGCCGMGGAFGYETEHFEVSMQVGELVLLPAIRDANDKGSLISAPGTSCRSQILDGTGIQADHPIKIIAGLLP